MHQGFREKRNDQCSSLSPLSVAPCVMDMEKKCGQGFVFTLNCLRTNAIMIFSFTTKNIMLNNRSALFP